MSNIRMDQSMVNGAVNTIFQNVTNPKGIKASKAAADVADNNNDGYISKQELKDALNSNYRDVFVSLKDHEGASWESRETSRDVAEKLDKADGREDGLVDGKGLWDAIGVSSLVSRLMTGASVIGKSILTREDAKSRGTVLELHHNADGLKITKGQ